MQTINEQITHLSRKENGQANSMRNKLLRCMHNNPNSKNNILKQQQKNPRFYRRAKGNIPFIHKPHLLKIRNQ